MDSSVALVVHGHFYQPPRENPWTGEIEREPGAEPFHDWNARIFHECYRANAYARVVDDVGRVERIVNNYVHLSFNFGPTLMSWLERNHTITYGRILAADRESARQRGGHGNGIAQGYNHLILPLANARDRATQVRWGMADFRHRFGRISEGIWLPETGASHDVLETLIAEGVRYTILSPYQASRTRYMGSHEWHDASGGKIDPNQAYRYFHRDGSGRFVDIFFYDGPKSRAVAFEGGLASSHGFLDHLMLHHGGPGTLVSVATDGESYGHHKVFGDRCIAHALEVEAKRRGLWVTNYGEFLERCPPRQEVLLDHGPDGRGSSWSCAHGVGRWFRDCGCHTGGREGWNQAWREPLRAALDLLRDQAATLFEERSERLLKDPWEARNDYIQVILRGPEATSAFFKVHAPRHLSAAEESEALTLLQMQHHAMLMYTSCGWFFSDLSGIETRQILKYAGRVLDGFNELGVTPPVVRFQERLAEAKSNRQECGNGADVYRRFVDPVRVTPHRVAAHLAMTSLLEAEEAGGELAGYDFERSEEQTRQHGQLRLSTSRIRLSSRATRRRADVASVAMHLGGVDLYCALRPWTRAEDFEAAANKLWARFTTASLPTLLRIAATEFGPEEYGLEHLLPGGPERISERALGSLLQRFTEVYANLYEDHRRTLDQLQTAGFTLPKELAAAAEFTLGRRFEEEVESQHQSQDPAAYKRAIEIAEQAATQGYSINRATSSRTFGHMITHSVHVALARPTRENFASALQLLDLTFRLHLDPHTERAQEAVYFAVRRARDFPQPEFERLMTALKIAPQVLERALSDGASTFESGLQRTLF